MNKSYKYLYFVNDIKFAQCFYSLKSNDCFIASSIQGKLELLTLQNSKTTVATRFQMSKDK